MTVVSSKHIFVIGADEFPVGSCFLKAIIGKSTVDTAATVHVLRNSISNLAAKMTEFGCDVKAFNLYVDQIRNSLFARGQSCDELLLNLFKAYSVTTDSDFVYYIKAKQHAFNEGTPISVDTLMSAALADYELKLEDGTWNAPDIKDTKIVALEAKIGELAKTKKKEQNVTPSAAPRGNDDRYAWKKVKPKNGEKTKTVSKKLYHWCPKHDAWVIHTPEKCNLPDTNKKPDQSNKDAPASPKSLSISKAYRALVDDDDDKSQDDEE